MQPAAWRRLWKRLQSWSPLISSAPPTKPCKYSHSGSRMRGSWACIIANGTYSSALIFFPSPNSCRLLLHPKEQILLYWSRWYQAKRKAKIVLTPPETTALIFGKAVTGLSVTTSISPTARGAECHRPRYSEGWEWDRGAHPSAPRRVHYHESLPAKNSLVLSGAGWKTRIQTPRSQEQPQTPSLSFQLQAFSKEDQGFSSSPMVVVGYWRHCTWQSMCKFLSHFHFFIFYFILFFYSFSWLNQSLC